MITTAGPKSWTSARSTPSTICSASPARRPWPPRSRHVADPIRVERAKTGAAAVRGFAETRHAAKSWKKQRRVVARIEATPLGLDIRYVVTSLQTPSPEDIYAKLYCARGQAENLIKLHKAQLKSDRTSCRSPLANQVRLILHAAAYWLMLTVRDAVPKTHALCKSEFATLRLKVLKIGARIRETTHRVRIAFAAACPIDSRPSSGDSDETRQFEGNVVSVPDESKSRADPTGASRDTPDPATRSARSLISCVSKPKCVTV